MSDISKYALNKLVKGGLYVGLSGDAGEPNSGGYQRKLIQDAGELSWSNTGDSPWQVSDVAIYQNPTDEKPITTLDAGRGADPAPIRKNDVFRVNLKF